MRRDRLERACAAVLLLWFACITGAPASLHSCPVHDRSPATADRPSSHAAGHIHAAHASHDHGQSTPRDDHRACTCIGDCSASGVAPALPVMRVTLLAFVSVVGGRAFQPIDSPPPAPPAFLLPYANGPPGPARVV